MGCEHRGCKCEERSIERGGKSFCSEFCANAETSGRHEASCRCGHPDCAA
jgi:hypothetical protein